MVSDESKFTGTKAKLDGRADLFVSFSLMASFRSDRKVRIIGGSGKTSVASDRIHELISLKFGLKASFPIR